MNMNDNNMVKENSKHFLYEANLACGIIYLTIDNNLPVFIGFHNRIKVEIKLDKGKLPVMQQHCFSESICSVAANHDENLASWPRNESNHVINHDLLTTNTSVNIKHTLSQSEKQIQGSESKSHKVVHRKEKPVASAEKVAPEKTAKRKKFVKVAKKEKTGIVPPSKECFRRSQNNIRHEKYWSVMGETTLSQNITDTPDCDSNSESDLEEKLKPSEIEAKVNCEFCFKKFDSRREFFNHRRSKSEPHECSKCKKIFPFRAHLLIHMKEHKGPKKGGIVRNEKYSICDVCGHDSKTITRLKKHMLSHTGEYYYKCCVCDKGISGFGALNNHMVSHRSAGMIKCNCCEQYFSSRAELSRHQLALLEIKCHLCGNVFPNRTSRTVHYKLAHPDSILKCHICSHMFSSDEELTSHMIYHTKYKKKQCTTCGKFVSRLEKHILTHKSLKDVDESELYICDKCPMKFMLKSSLQRHQRTHSEERPFECYQCPKTFACRSVLLKHIKSHSSVMPYECEVCGKRCKEKSNLKVHMRTHSDSKAFPCTLCNQAFGYKNSLEAHMKSKHSLHKSTVVIKRELDLSEYRATEPKNLESIKQASVTRKEQGCPLEDENNQTQELGSTIEVVKGSLNCIEREYESIGNLSLANRQVLPCLFSIDPRLAVTRDLYTHQS